MPSEAKRTLLARLLSERAAAGVRVSAPAADRPWTLSFGQRRIWFAEQLSPGTCAYLVPVAIRIRGSLDRAALARALGEIVARHDALRTTFPLVDDRPVAQVAPPRPVPLAIEDMTTADPSAREEAVRRVCRDEIRVPIDIVNGPIVRMRLLQLAADDHVLLVTAHHLVCDGVSVGVLLREIAAGYDAFAAGVPPSLPALPMAFSEFAAWEARHVDTPAVGEQLQYWTSRLAGSPILDLPADRLRPAHTSHRGAIAWRTLSLAQVRALRAVGQRGRGSLFMVLLAAFKTLLARYSDQEDVIVGSPVAGRSNPATEPLIGCFVNTLALRTDLSGDPSFLELLGRVRETALNAYQRAEVPFDKVVDTMQLERDLTRAPLVQVFFNMVSLAAAPHALRGLSVQMIDAEEEGAKFDLTLYAIERPDDLLLRMVYAADLFDAATIDQMLQRYALLLEAIAADPACRLSALPLVSDVEQLGEIAAFNVALA
ncbi:MAG TPA: condensation domain-containing protein [Vicinamibacterales bacterium]|nr:condensation domain-containing protein [Vicinamibacterales bacterium]